MLRIYKYQIMAVLFLIYSMGVWHVAKTYTQSSYKDEKIALQQQVMETTEQRAQLSADIGKQVEAAVGKMKITQQTINQKVIHEITKERVYTECVTTPDGVRLIEDTIGNKGPSTR